MPIQRFLERLVWACLLPVFGFATALALTDLTHRAQAERASGLRSAAELMDSLDNYLRARQQALQLLASGTADLQASTLAVQYREARAFQSIFGNHVILAHLDGRMIFNTRSPLGTELLSLPAPQGPSAVEAAIRSGQPAVGGRVIGPVARLPLVPVVVPVLWNGRPGAVLLCTVETRELQALVENWKLPAFIGVRLLDAQGQVLASRAPDGVAGPDAVARSAAPHASEPELRSSVAAWRLEATVDPGALRTLQWKLATELAAALVAEPVQAAPVQALGARPILEIVRARRHLDALAAERERAHAEVRDSESRLRQLLVALRDPVGISVDDRIVFANPAAERLVGVPAGHMIGRTILDFLQPESVERARPLLQRVGAGETEVLFEGMRFADPDAPPRTLRISGVTLSLPEGQATLTLVRDITELYRTRGALERSNRDLVRLVERLNTVEEEERRRIARELHDDLQQRLGVIVMEQQQAARELPPVATASTTALARAQAMADQAIDSVRRIVRSLRPQALDELGLAAALEVLVREWSQQGGMQAECEVIGPEGADAQLPPAVASCFYRVAQESLTNVRKHARASFAHVVLDLSQPGTATLQISDDGKGLDTTLPPGNHSFGIRGMRERLQALGGQLVIEAAPGSGTRVQAKVAWPAA